MLRVTFEIVPQGQEDHPNKRTIGTMVIALQSVNEMNIGTYTSQLVSDVPVPADVVKIDNHWRHDGAYDLVRRCLEEHLGCGL